MNTQPSPTRDPGHTPEEPSGVGTLAQELVAPLTRGARPEDLFSALYGELRRLARRYISHERTGHTLQPTALVHEAYLRLAGAGTLRFNDRAHFFAVGARAMRRVLVDHAREHRREKRGGAWQRVTLSGLAAPVEEVLDLDEILALDEAIERLATADGRAARVVELRFFAGLTVPEVATCLAVSPRTVEAEWTYARAWLKRELARSGMVA